MTEIGAVAVSGAIVAVCGVAKPVVEKGCDLIGKLLDGPMTVAGGMLEDRMYLRRIARGIETAAEAADHMKRAGIVPRRLPESFMLPFLEAAGAAPDSAVKSMFARLLASAVADDAAQHPLLRSALSEINGDEAKILERLVEAGSIQALHIMPTPPPNISMFWADPDDLGLASKQLTMFYFSNLRRLGLLAPGHDDEGDDDGGLKSRFARIAEDLFPRGTQVILPLKICLDDLGEALCDVCIRDPKRDG